MAIERAEETEIVEESSEATASIPLAILQGKTVNPGDVIRLKVVSSDPESETVTVKYASDGAPLKGDDTINQMTSRYKRPTMESE